MESLGLSPQFWRGRRVFLTGHTGFKGSWLSLWLQSLGAELTGYALAPHTNPSLFTEAEIAKGMHCITGDVRDPAMLSQSMRAARPEVVIHMAAQSLVRSSLQQPIETYSTNVMGTVHMLQAVRATPDVRAVVCVTSDKCYASDASNLPHQETDPMGGDDPYSSSKGCAELVCAAYRRSFGVAIATARAGNVMGGGDWSEDRLIPDLVRAYGEDRVAAIRNPQAIRPWQHVLEPLRGYLMLAERLVEGGFAFAQAWNFGPDADDAKPVQWVVEQMSHRLGNRLRWQLDRSPQPPEAACLRLATEKAHSQLGWQPAIGLDSALDLTVDWYRGHLKGADMKRLTLDQIHHADTQQVQ